MKEIHLDNVFPALLGYFRTMPNVGDSAILGLSSLIGFIGLYYLIAFIIPQKQSRTVYFRRQISLYFASLVFLLALGTIAVIFTSYENWIFRKHLQIAILSIYISGLIVLVLSIGAAINNVKTNASFTLGFTTGPLNFAKRNLGMLTDLKKLRLFSFLLFLPFLVLLIPTSKRILYSIVFDNSASMAQLNLQAQGEIDRIMANSKGDLEFVVTYIPICNDSTTCLPYFDKMQRSLERIVSVSSIGTLNAVSIHLQGNAALSAYLLNPGIPETNASSPIYECIWDNYLYAHDLDARNSFPEKKLIVLTDGSDVLHSGIPDFVAPNGCISTSGIEGGSIESFFQEIIFVNYLGSSGPNDLFGSCPNATVLDGQNKNALATSLLSGLKDVYFDVELLFILGFLIAIGLIAIFIRN